MMRTPEQEILVTKLDFTDCPEGPLFEPMAQARDVEREHLLGWTAPLTPWGGFRLDPGIAVTQEAGRKVLSFTGPKLDRALTYEGGTFRDCHITASVAPIDTDASAHNDRNDCTQALVGIVFRIQTSRSYYQFGIEGRQRLVLYRRWDDEWCPLAEQAVELPEGYLTLDVRLDGDAMHCHCPELEVTFLCVDSLFQMGKVGFRSQGRSHVSSLCVTQSPSQSRRNSRYRRERQATEHELGEPIPDPVLVKTFEPAKLGGTPRFMDFIQLGRFDMLIAMSQGLRAMTVEGEILWETDSPVQPCVFSKVCGENGRRIYGFAGKREIKPHNDIRGNTQNYVIADEMVVLDGGTGELLAKRRLPELHERIRMPDYAQTSADFTGTGGHDIVLREWRESLGGGGRYLWAYDGDLNPIWQHEVEGAWYGHHYSVQVCDPNGDGRDELLAGGTLLDAEGNVIWKHDRDAEMARISGAGHYDAVILDALTGDDAQDPVAFLIAGSAGVYVIDGLTGRTRTVHRVGHAQGRVIGKLRKDLPGRQVLVMTRWGNMGILTLFSGNGDRLWSIQPDYIGQGAQPIQWGSLEPQLIWTNTTSAAQALYDGYGRRVKVLTELQRLWGDRIRTKVSTQAIRMGTDQTDYLLLGIEGKLYVFGPPDQ